MSNEASVAPKERVNIVYRPAEGNGHEEVELPMKLLVLGDFTGAPNATPMEHRGPVSIDKDNFDDVMKGQNIALQLNVSNRLSEEPQQELCIGLKFQGMRDFGPEAAIEQVPQLKRILELREALRALKGPLANVPEFRRKLEAIIGDEATRAKLLTEIGAREDEP